MKLLDAGRNAFLASLLPVMVVWSVLFYLFLVNQIETGQQKDLEEKRNVLEQKIKDNPALIYSLTPFDLGASAIPISVQDYASKFDFFSDTTLINGRNGEIRYRTLSWPYRAPESNQYFQITLYETFQEVEILKKNLLPFIVLFFIGCVGLSLVAQRIIFGRVWKPFYKTLEQMKNYDVQEATPLLTEKTQVKEFQDLNDAMQMLSRRAQFAYSSQKHFIENTSHEIQTPLAVMKSKIELAFQNPNLPDEQVKLLLELNQSLTKLSKLNKALLLLSRLENDQFIDRREIPIAVSIRDALGFFEEKIRSKGIKVKQIFEPEVFITANKIIFEILINNLIKNAVYHNMEGGDIQIYLKKGHLSIKNTAKNSSGDVSDLPSRYQSDPSNTNSTGLGLSIVKKICEVSGLNYEIAKVKGIFIFDLRW